MSRDRRVGLVVVLGGLLAVAAVQRIAPIATPPLFDGVTVVEPYRWLVPGAGQAGNPASAQDTTDVEGGASPTVIVATTESPPQAQMFASSGELAVPKGGTRIDLSIAPILPSVLPTRGHISGNVYRVSVTTEDGEPVKPVKGSQVTVVLRGPESQAVTRAKISRFTDKGWVTLDTSDAGLPGTYLAVVSDFGDFALIAPGAGGPYPTATPSPRPTRSPTASPTPTPMPMPTPTSVAIASPGSTGVPSPTPGGGGAVSPAASPDPAVVLLAIGAILAAAITIVAFMRRRRRWIR